MEINHSFANLGMFYLLRSIILPQSHDRGHRCSRGLSLADKLPSEMTFLRYFRGRKGFMLVSDVVFQSYTFMSS